MPITSSKELYHQLTALREIIKPDRKDLEARLEIWTAVRAQGEMPSAIAEALSRRGLTAAEAQEVSSQIADHLAALTKSLSAVIDEMLSTENASHRLEDAVVNAVKKADARSATEFRI